MEIENSSPDLKEGITFEPVELEEIPPPSKEDLELMLMWNMKMFPFLIENYDVIIKRIEFEPVELEEIPPPSKEDLELIKMWNLKLFPFLLRNYDMIFKGEGHSNHVHVIHSNFCPKQL